MDRVVTLSTFEDGVSDVLLVYSITPTPTSVSRTSESPRGKTVCLVTPTGVSFLYPFLPVPDNTSKVDKGRRVLVRGFFGRQRTSRMQTPKV